MANSIPDSNLPTLHAESGVSLRDITFVLFRRRWIILAIAIPIILLGGISLTRQTGSFTASSRVVVELVKVDLPRWNTSNSSVNYDRELSTLFNIAMSLPVAELAAFALADSLPAIKALIPDLVDQEEDGVLVDFLQNGSDVSVVGESAILEFNFTCPDPRVSLMASGALRDAFVQFQVHGRKNVEAIAYYEEQITAVRAEIDSLLNHRGEVLRESGYSSLKDELRFESGHASDLDSQLSDAIIAAQTIETEYKLLAGYLNKDPRDFPMGRDESQSQTLVYWRNLVGNYDDKLSATLVVNTEQSVLVKRHREILDGAILNLKREQQNYVNSYHHSLLSAQEKVKAINGEISKVRASSSKGPEVYQLVSLLDTEIETLRNLFKDLQSKRGEVRLSQMADERVSSIVILTDPEISRIISGGKTLVYLVVIVIFAFAFGVVVAFIIENLDHRIYSPRDIEQNLNLPVFASVSKVD